MKSAFPQHNFFIKLIAMEICCIYQVDYLRKLSQSDSSPIYGLLSNKSAAAGHSEGGAASFISGTIFICFIKKITFL